MEKPKMLERPGKVACQLPGPRDGAPRTGLERPRSLNTATHSGARGGALWVQRDPVARSDRWPVWLGLHFICFLYTQYLLCAKKEMWEQI